MVVNFEDNKGYIVMSASKFNEPIIAACDRGNLDPNVVIDNPNLLPILANTDAILSYNEENRIMTDLVDEFGKPLHPFPFPIPENSIDTFYTFGRWTVMQAVGPLVPVEWGQLSPYNGKLDEITGKKPPTGCVPTAVAQIMAFHKYPKTYDWNQMITTPLSDYGLEQIQTLFKDLGKKDHLDVTYTLGISLADSRNAPHTFRNFGYESGELVAYNASEVEEEIAKERRPVYVRANSTKYIEDGLRYLIWGNLDGAVEYGGGHAWVIDGYKFIQREVQGFSLSKNNVKTREQ